MDRVIFLDRDGTINEEVEYLHRPEDLRFLPGVGDAIRRLRENGFAVVVVTNQAGVARGYYKEEDVSKTPLFLDPGTYTFSAISPAKASYKDGTCMIKNGEYVIATNNAWTQTESTTCQISGNEGIILLNPLMQVTSRMKFLIKGTDKISDLSIMQAGVEIDGIQIDPTTGNNYTVGDNMPSKLGDKYNRIYVPAKSFVTTSEGILQGETGILPTDCRSTPVVVIMNVLVNDVPTQFTYSIVGKQFLSGYSYNYTVTLDIKDGITVANWQESSWTADIDPDK